MADIASGEALYNKYSEVNEEGGGWLSLRDIVLSRKMSRRMLVQPLTVIKGIYLMFGCHHACCCTLTVSGQSHYMTLRLVRVLEVSLVPQTQLVPAVVCSLFGSELLILGYNNLVTCQSEGFL